MILPFSLYFSVGMMKKITFAARIVMVIPLLINGRCRDK